MGCFRNIRAVDRFALWPAFRSDGSCGRLRPLHVCSFHTSDRVCWAAARNSCDGCDESDWTAASGCSDFGRLWIPSALYATGRHSKTGEISCISSCIFSLLPRCGGRLLQGTNAAQRSPSVRPPLHSSTVLSNREVNLAGGFLNR